MIGLAVALQTLALLALLTGAFLGEDGVGLAWVAAGMSLLSLPALAIGLRRFRPVHRLDLQ